MNPVRHCIVCEHRSDKSYRGVMLCKRDDRTVVVHVRSNYCPHPSGPRFGDGMKPADWDATPRLLIPIASDAQVEALLARDKAEGGCGCAG